MFCSLVYHACRLEPYVSVDALRGVGLVSKSPKPDLETGPTSIQPKVNSILITLNIEYHHVSIQPSVPKPILFFFLSSVLINFNYLNIRKYNTYKWNMFIIKNNLDLCYFCFTSKKTLFTEVMWNLWRICATGMCCYFVGKSDWAGRQSNWEINRSL